MKTFTESLVAVIEFDGATNRQTFNLVQADGVFEDWTCARPTCGRVLEQEDTLKALDGKLAKWRTEKDLCVFID